MKNALNDNDYLAYIAAKLRIILHVEAYRGSEFKVRILQSYSCLELFDEMYAPCWLPTFLFPRNKKIERRLTFQNADNLSASSNYRPKRIHVGERDDRASRLVQYDKATFAND